MRSMRRWFLATAPLGLACCSATLRGLTVPPQVWAGQVFEVVIDGGTDGQGGGAGASLQLPNGFSVEGALAMAIGSGTYIVPNGAPANLSLLTPEPGHYAITFFTSVITGLSTPSRAQLKVYVRAPASVTGPFTFKVAALGTDNLGNIVVTDPPGASTFAALTAPPYVQSTTVVGTPTAPFVMETPGLLTSTTQGEASGVAFGDVDGDGNDDLVHVVGTYPFVLGPFWQRTGAPAGTTVWLSRPGSAWLPSAPPGAAAGASYLRAAFGDFDGDGHLDLADTAGRVLFGDGGTSWTPGPALPLLVPDWGGVAVGDVDGDGLADVAFSAFATDAVQVFRSLGNRTFADWSGNLPSGTNGTAGADHLRLVDVTGDGLCDLVAGGGIGGRVWAGDGQSNWTPAGNGLPAFGAFAVGDVNGDGRVDLVFGGATNVVVYERVAGAWQVLPMNGAPPVPVLGSVAAIALLDHDRDGLLDLVVATAGVTVFDLLLVPNLGNQAWGAPQPVTTLLSRTVVNDLAVGDIDGDSWPDLAAAVYGEHPLVWRNTGSGLSPFGSACGAAGFPTPALATSGALQLGSNTFAFELQNASPNGFGIVWLGFSRRYAFGLPILPLSLQGFGAPDCSVVASTDSPFFVVADALGRAVLPAPIPNNPLLERFTFFAQAAAAAPGANGLGWLVTGGLAVRIP